MEKKTSLGGFESIWQFPGEFCARAHTHISSNEELLTQPEYFKMEFSNLTVGEGPLGNKELNFQPICGFAFRLGPLHSGWLVVVAAGQKKQRRAEHPD